LSTPTPRRDTSAHVEPETASRPHDRDQKRYQLDQLLPPHSAWNHRVQKLAKGSSRYESKIVVILLSVDICSDWRQFSDL
jgi:hypothetical protein